MTISHLSSGKPLQGKGQNQYGGRNIPISMDRENKGEKERFRVRGRKCDLCGERLRGEGEPWKESQGGGGGVFQPRKEIFGKKRKGFRKS